jgi:uncharacterized protein
MQITDILSRELNLSAKQVLDTLTLLQDGATVPFIARYRKELTGGLDEVQITQIRDRAKQLDELNKRRESILNSIREQGKLTDALEQEILNADTMTRLEDLYLPYKPKRRTRAQIAREKGLEPLADWLMKQRPGTPEDEAERYLSEEKEVPDTAAALAGARDIIAEQVNEHAIARARIRNLYIKEGILKATVFSGKEEEGAKYRDYFERSEPIQKMPSHRVLALFRAAAEGILYLDISPEEQNALELLHQMFVKGQTPASEQVQMAVKDAYKRLMRISMETEIRHTLKEKADTEAIRVFSENVRELLMASPMGQKRTLALDPGLRTGCKTVALDAQGNLLDETVIYPHTGKEQQAAAQVQAWVQKYQIEAIAIGNGTGGRETEAFVRAIEFSHPVTIVMVNESGASVYSASEVAREEFPEHDLTVRGAVSIGRRLMDPLAELVKIDPKSIGVGQYQHDVSPYALKEKLDETVMSCVNQVGVELNTASAQLLSYVSGLGPALAKSIVAHRLQHGPFRSRKALKAVPRLGDKAFEQAAGFLRIRDAEHPLDQSAVHPERYALVEQMAKDAGCTVQDLMQHADMRNKIVLKNYISAAVGLPTLEDILKELARPGRDPRKEFEVFTFTEGIHKVEDLYTGMRLKGIVTNVTNFGAFVDVGVHQDGLVHISHLANKFVKDPADIVKPGQKVEVSVLEVDIKRKRISLSMKEA